MASQDATGPCSFIFNCETSFHHNEFGSIIYPCLFQGGWCVCHIPYTYGCAFEIEVEHTHSGRFIYCFMRKLPYVDLTSIHYLSSSHSHVQLVVDINCICLCVFPHVDVKFIATSNDIFCVCGWKYNAASIDQSHTIRFRK